MSDIVRATYLPIMPRLPIKPNQPIMPNQPIKPLRHAPSPLPSHALRRAARPHARVNKTMCPRTNRPSKYKQMLNNGISA